MTVKELLKELQKEKYDVKGLDVVYDNGHAFISIAGVIPDISNKRILLLNEERWNSLPTMDAKVKAQDEPLAVEEKV